MRLLVVLCILPCVLSIDIDNLMEKETSVGKIRAKRGESCSRQRDTNVEEYNRTIGTDEYKIGDDSYFLKTEDLILSIKTEVHYWSMSGYCNQTNTSTTEYDGIRYYTAGHCPVLNDPSILERPSREYSFGITPYHDDRSLGSAERFAKFGIAERESFPSGGKVPASAGAMSYAHGKGLRLYCDRNFEGTNSKTIDIVCEVANYNSRDVSEPGVWKDRATGTLFDKYTIQYPRCVMGFPTAVPEYDCVPPEFECDYYISDKTDCDETNGNIGCVLSIKCGTGNTAVQRFQCQFDQGWHNMDKDQKVYHPRIEQALDSC